MMSLCDPCIQLGQEEDRSRHREQAARKPPAVDSKPSVNARPTPRDSVRRISIVTIVAGAILVMVGNPTDDYGSNETSIIMGVIVALAGVALFAYNAARSQSGSAQFDADEDVQNVRARVSQYEGASHEFGFLSDETLTREHERYKRNGQEDLRRLALEEEMVRRNLLDHSPMHEKLSALREHFNF